jgi:hypothetical protein
VELSLECAPFPLLDQLEQAAGVLPPMGRLMANSFRSSGLALPEKQFGLRCLVDRSGACLLRLFAPARGAPISPPCRRALAVSAKLVHDKMNDRMILRSPSRHGKDYEAGLRDFGHGVVSGTACCLTM